MSPSLLQFWKICGPLLQNTHTYMHAYVHTHTHTHNAINGVALEARIFRVSRRKSRVGQGLHLTAYDYISTVANTGGPRNRLGSKLYYTAVCLEANGQPQR
jgi:hypothetical protein